MCEPTTIATATAAVLGTVASAMDAQQQANAANAHRRQQALATREEADRAARLELEQIATRSQEEADARATEAAATDKASLQARASAKTAAAEAGVAGTSIRNLLDDYENTRAGVNFQRDQQAMLAARRDAADVESVQQRRESRYRSSTPGYVSGPSALSVGASLAGVAADAYGDYKTKQSKKPKKRGPANSFSKSRISGYTYQEI